MSCCHVYVQLVLCPHRHVHRRSCLQVHRVQGVRKLLSSIFRNKNIINLKIKIDTFL